MLLSPCDCAIDANRLPTELSMPMMSFGLELPNVWNRLTTSPVGEALKLTTGAVPSKMFADVAVKVAVASVIGVSPVPEMNLIGEATLGFAWTLTVTLALRAPAGFGFSIRFVSVVVARSENRKRPSAATLSCSVIDPLKVMNEPGA